MQDATAILALARKFTSRAVFASFIAYDDDAARGTVLAALDRGVVFVLEVGGRIVGGIMGSLATVWFSRELVASELGWFVEDEHRGHGDELRRRFEAWGKSVGAPCSSLSDVKLDDAMPNGQLYERAGYEVVERSWLKNLRAG